jgi:hypothetical protein
MTTCKISIWIPTQRKHRRSKIPKTKLRSESEIPHDPIHHLAMRGAWWSLKTSAQTHD